RARGRHRDRALGRGHGRQPANEDGPARRPRVARREGELLMRARSMASAWVPAGIAIAIAVGGIGACGMLNGLDDFERVEGDRPTGGVGGIGGTGGSGGSTTTSGGGGQGGQGTGGSDCTDTMQSGSET